MPFFFSSRRRHTRFDCDWSSDVCSSDLGLRQVFTDGLRILPTPFRIKVGIADNVKRPLIGQIGPGWRSEEHTSELQSQSKLVCRLLLEKKKTPYVARSAFLAVVRSTLPS